MNDKYVVISGFYENETNRSNFVQAIGTYNDKRSAYGAAILHLNECVDSDKGEMITPLFRLECDTGAGMEVKHERTTDFCYVLLGGPDGWEEEEEGDANDNR